jgi:hypothetical protein
MTRPLGVPPSWGLPVGLGGVLLGGGGRHPIVPPPGPGGGVPVALDGPGDILPPIPSTVHIPCRRLLGSLPAHTEGLAHDIAGITYLEGTLRKWYRRVRLDAGKHSKLCPLPLRFLNAHLARLKPLEDLRRIVLEPLRIVDVLAVYVELLSGLRNRPARHRISGRVRRTLFNFLNKVSACPLSVPRLGLEEGQRLGRRRLLARVLAPAVQVERQGVGRLPHGLRRLPGQGAQLPVGRPGAPVPQEGRAVFYRARYRPETRTQGGPSTPAR